MSFESLLSIVRLPIAASPVSRSVQNSQSDRVLEGRPGCLHDEATFRHFLAIERRRSAVGERKCLLLLVRVPLAFRGHSVPELTMALSAALEEAVRDIDVIGWYRQGRVAAVLLPQGLDSMPSGVPSRIVERIRQRLVSRFTDGIAGPRLRLVRLGGSGRM